MAEPRQVVLVVDDEPDIVEVTCGCLQNRGFSTDGATSGQEALEKIESSPPDVVLLDISMPGMNGVEVIQKLRAKEATKHLPIIVLSALVDAKNVIRCFDEGADDYVIKPPDYSELAARLRRHIASARPAGEAPQLGVRSGIPPEKLKAVESAVKQIALAAQLAQERNDKEFRLQCLERIQGFCSFAIKVLNEKLPD